MAASPISIDPYLEDASGYRGEAERVFQPATVAEVEEIVVAAARKKIPLTVAGAGTGLTGARVPHGGWVISTHRFRKLEVSAGKARCGAAISLKDLQAATSPSKQFFGPNPTESLASVGGVINTNAGGARSFRYGSVRRHVLALQVTFMDGTTREIRRGERVDFPVPALRRPNTTKNSAGYFMEPDVEWVQLLSGSEGTLGIVTEAEVQLLPEPPGLLSGVVFFRSDEAALDAVDAWRSVPKLRLLEYLDNMSLRLLETRHESVPAAAQAALLIEQDLSSDSDAELDAWAERLSETGALDEESWFGLTPADWERFRELRHTLPVTVIDRVRRNGFRKFSTDFAVPLDRSRDMLAYYRKLGDQIFPGQYLIFGHIGDANVHVNFLPETAEQAKAGVQMIEDFARFAVEAGGTVAAEHGVGKQKAKIFKLMYSADEIESMRSVKRHLDPQMLLGQGTIFGN